MTKQIQNTWAASSPHVPQSCSQGCLHRDKDLEIHSVASGVFPVWKCDLPLGCGWAGAAPSPAKSAGHFLLAAPFGFPFPLLAAPTCHHLVISVPSSTKKESHLLCHPCLHQQLQHCSLQPSAFKISLTVSAIYSNHIQTCSSGLLWFHTAQLSEMSPEENSFFSPQKVRNIVEVQLIKRTLPCLILSDRWGFRAKQGQPMWVLQILKKWKGRGGNRSKLVGVMTVSGDKYHNPTNCSWPTSLPAAEGLALSWVYSDQICVCHSVGCKSGCGSDGYAGKTGLCGRTEWCALTLSLTLYFAQRQVLLLAHE